MHGRRIPGVIAPLAVTGLLAVTGSLTACGGSTPKPAAPAAAATSITRADGSLPSADCVIIRSIAGGVVASLIPLKSEPHKKANASLHAYIASLDTARSKLASAQAKAVLGAFIAALERTSTQSVPVATQYVSAAVGKLGAACP
jgi:hypothetical protein